MRVVVLGILPLLVAACPRPTTQGASPDAAPAPVASVAPPAPVEAAAPEPPAPKGTARLVIQHVEAQCSFGPGDTHSFTVGYDLLIETQDGADAGAPAREHVFCPKVDGGAPRLGIWRNCREDKAPCTVNEGAVKCGKDTVSLEVKDGKTILVGPFGDRVVAPYPMNLAAPIRIKRIANVDC